MASPSLFVSYSHHDAGAIEQLRRFLRPLERDQGIAWWDDSRIEEGRVRAAEIAQALDAATAAVLLISQDFIDSELITRSELPHLLARAEAGELTILPVFLGHSTVELTPYSYVDLGSGVDRREFCHLDDIPVIAMTLIVSVQPSCRSMSGIIPGNQRFLRIAQDSRVTGQVAVTGNVVNSTLGQSDVNPLASR